MKVLIEKMVYGGAALGHPADRSAASMVSDVLLPFCLPGEIVDALDLKAGGEALPGEIFEASVHRRPAECAHFGECGGCHYQHASYPAQLGLKQSILEETMQRAEVPGLPPIEVHAGPEWGYRNRIRLRLESSNGAFQAGYNRRESHAFLPIHECTIAAPVLWRAATALIALARSNAAAQLWIAAVSEVEIFTSHDEARIQMAFSLRGVEGLRSAGALRPGTPAGFPTFCEALHAILPELAGAGAAIDSDLGRRERRAWKPVSWGAEGLSYEVAGKPYWVTRGAFFQVNRFLLDDLVGLVTGDRSGSIAWDLYAGVGLFSLPLAQRFGRVVAVESAEPAASDLARMLARLDPNHTSTHATALDFLRAAVLQRERPDLIVMDPPRAGVGAEVCSLLLRLAVPNIVYVSCDPPTLARDLRLLTLGGYTVREIHLVDLFPQTFHIETVVMLERNTR